MEVQNFISTEHLVLPPAGAPAVWRHVPAEGRNWTSLPILPLHPVLPLTRLSAAWWKRLNRDAQHTLWCGGDDPPQHGSSRHWCQSSAHWGECCFEKGEVSLWELFCKFLMNLLYYIFLFCLFVCNFLFLFCYFYCLPKYWVHLTIPVQCFNSKLYPHNLQWPSPVFQGPGSTTTGVQEGGEPQYGSLSSQTAKQCQRLQPLQPLLLAHHQDCWSHHYPALHIPLRHQRCKLTIS